MSAYRFLGFYPAHYDTPTGSRYVNPGDVVDWHDGPPDGWWTPDTADETAAAPEPDPEPIPAPTLPDIEE